ncbi:MAG: hypothetical protein J6W27_03260 [Alphaproteobacteria bacterium]|nr:hypothetical protein [Alphaproteobacteria bacterium]
MKEKIEKIIDKMKTRKAKNITYLVCFTLFFVMFAYRFYVVEAERNANVFNIIRNNASTGTPVNVITVSGQDGFLHEPVNIRNNRAYVAGNRVGMFKVGQNVGNCKISYVSNNIDLDTGMYVIKTSKCEDGLRFIENKKHGFYVPVSAVSGNYVYVVNGGVAQKREVVISGRDLQNVVIQSGLNDGDMVILSNVKDNQKIRVVK